MLHMAHLACEVREVRETVLRTLLVALEFECLERNTALADKIGALTSRCVCCGIECANCCRFCGITVCLAGCDQQHVSSRCILYNQLPSVVRDSSKFHLSGLARILRTMAPPEHPVARPLCASGNKLVDSGLAEQLLLLTHDILADEIPEFAVVGLAERPVHHDVAVRMVCDSARGLAEFAALMDAESQRGVRLVAIGTGQETLVSSTCCPYELADTVPPSSTAAWRQICLSYNLPENEQRPLCAAGARCIGAKIMTRDKRPFGRPLRAMRSPIGELLSDASDTVGGLCLYCTSAEIVGNMHARLLWQDPEGMFLKQYMVNRGNFALVAPVVHDVFVSSYKIGDVEVFYVDESAMRAPSTRHF